MEWIEHGDASYIELKNKQIGELTKQLAEAQATIAALTVEKEAIYAALTDEGPAVIYRVTKRVLNARHVSPPAQASAKEAEREG